MKYFILAQKEGNTIYDDKEFQEDYRQIFELIFDYYSDTYKSNSILLDNGDIILGNKIVRKG